MPMLDHKQMQPGYAETSTRRRPINPETVVVSEADCRKAKYVGEANIDGRCGWVCYRIGRRFYFQYRPW